MVTDSGAGCTTADVMDGWRTLSIVRTIVVGERPAELEAWLARRRSLGLDLFDEMWNGEYHVAPAPHRRHGDIDDQLAALLRPLARAAGLWPSGPLNIGRPEDYRVPDRAYLADRRPRAFEPSAAVVVEIASPGDETWDKFAFYFAARVEEVLVVDPLAHRVEWFARGADGFTETAGSRRLAVDTEALAAQLDWPD